MEVNVFATSEFSRRAKKYAKKFKSFVEDYRIFLASIKENPFQGVDLGGGKRKIRMVISSKNAGKSGGSRVITYNVVKNADSSITVYLVTIYDKSEFDSVSDSYVDQIISQI